MKRVSIYLMAGKQTPELAAAAVAGGADLLEIGFPFSDPLADGPVIRLAGERALAEGMRTQACLECLAETRAKVDVPLIPMTYASILEAYGYERFRDDAEAADPRNLEFAAWDVSGVWVNSLAPDPTVNPFEQGPVMIDEYLLDYVKILHPALVPDHELVFFAQVPPS